MKFKDYRKYRWFFTYTKKLVVGGKNAEQNEELLRDLKTMNKNYLVMHTAEPGSPFSVILSDKKPIKSDIEETAIFTACFSKQWKLQKKKTEVHIFNLSQLYKTDSMKTGTWGVKGEIKKMSVPLELILTKQKSKLRAVSEKTVKSEKYVLARIIPGKIDKQLILGKLQKLLKNAFDKEEILQALPSGGIVIKK